MDCVFCKIIAGEIPATKIYEDENVLAFLDIAPAAPFHAVFVPKAHIPSARAINAENSFLAAKIFEAAAKTAVEQNLENGFRMITNDGEDGGQTVHHLHFHLLGGRKLGALG